MIKLFNTRNWNYIFFCYLILFILRYFNLLNYFNFSIHSNAQPLSFSIFYWNIPWIVHFIKLMPLSSLDVSLPSLFPSLLKGLYFSLQAVHLVSLHHSLLLPSVHSSPHVPSLWVFRRVLFLASPATALPSCFSTWSKMYLVDTFNQTASQNHKCIQI